MDAIEGVSIAYVAPDGGVLCFECMELEGHSLDGARATDADLSGASWSGATSLCSRCGFPVIVPPIVGCQTCSVHKHPSNMVCIFREDDEAVYQCQECHYGL